MILKNYISYADSVLDTYKMLVEEEYIDSHLGEIDLSVIYNSAIQYAQYNFEGPILIEDQRLIHPYLFIVCYGISTDFNISLEIFDDIYKNLEARVDGVLSLINNMSFYIKMVLSKVVDTSEYFYNKDLDYSKMESSGFWLDENYKHHKEDLIVPLDDCITAVNNNKKESKKNKKSEDPVIFRIFVDNKGNLL